MAISVKPSENYPHIIMFDGMVLEVFSRNREANLRIHLGQVKGIQLSADPGGRQRLIIRWIGEALPEFQVDEAQREKTAQLVTAVQQALAAFKF